MDDNLIKLIDEAISIQNIQYFELSNNVNYIINNNICNENQIEHTLDLIMDLIFIDSRDKLFAKLLKYYYKINPISTKDYLELYNEYNDKKLKLRFK